MNELSPTRSDFEELRKEVRERRTDVLPAAGSPDEKSELGSTAGKAMPALSFGYRLQRAVRIVAVTGPERTAALSSFDEVVGHIELCRAHEMRGISILAAWERNSSSERTCTVCDHRTCCPD